MSFIINKLTLLAHNLALLPRWVIASYFINLGLMLLWHYFLRPSLGYTNLLPTFIVVITGFIANFILARLVYAGYPQSLLMPITTAMGGLMPITIGMFIRHEPASPGRIICLCGAVSLTVLASLF